MARQDSLTPHLAVETYQPDQTGPVRSATMPWWLAAAGGALVCAIAGWAVVAACVLVAQLAGTGSVTAAAVDLATRGWLLIHGGVLEWGGARITLVPLTLTVVVAVALHGVAGYAARQLAPGAGSPARPGWDLLRVTALVALAYGIAVTVTALGLDPGGPSLRAGLGAFLLGAVMAFWGARKALRWEPKAWPAWLRVVPQAMGAGLLVALLGGVLVLLAGLLSHRGQFVALTDQLQPGWGGGVVLALVQLFFLVNMIVWCAAWSFGPGFTLGDGSVVSLAGSSVGLLPAFPVTSALPAGGVTSPVCLVWLLVPLAAGAAAAAMVMRARPRARFDETALVGGLSGLLSGLAVVLVAVATRGDLGSDRLSGLGPVMVPLLVIAPCLMGLAGILVGLVAGLVRRPYGRVEGPWWARWSPAGPGPEAAGESGEESRAETGGRAEDRTVRSSAEDLPTERIGQAAPAVDEQPPLDFHADRW